MPRSLPLNANLEHLHKQAKHRLREWQQTNPNAQLADALHAIAGEYGFATWPKLKAHIEALPRAARASAASDGSSGGPGLPGGAAAGAEPRGYGFDRYTPKAREAVFFSRYEAAHSGTTTIDPEHVLLGLARADARGPRILAVLALDETRAFVDDGAPSGPPLPSSTPIPFGSEARQILGYAVEEADRLQHSVIGLAHLLAGVLRLEDSRPAQLLVRRTLTLDRLREQIPALIEQENGQGGRVG
jgi:hypothetical protein